MTPLKFFERSAKDPAGGQGWSIDPAHFWPKKNIGIVVSGRPNRYPQYTHPASHSQTRKKCQTLPNPRPRPLTGRRHARPPPATLQLLAAPAAAARRTCAFAPAPAPRRARTSPGRPCSLQACTARRLAPARVAAARRLALRPAQLHCEFPIHEL